MKHLCMSLLVAFGASQSGCASIVHGTTQQVQIESEPSGAQIHINGHYRGTTPKTLELQRGGSYQLLLEHPGYQPWDLDLERRFSAWALGNVVSGILPGAALDVVDGAAFRIFPPGVTATLAPVRQAPAEAPFSRVDPELEALPDVDMPVRNPNPGE